MDISNRGPDYEVDGEPHEIIVLVAVVSGAVLASIILIILIAMIERSKKNQPQESQLNTSPNHKQALDEQIYTQSALNRSISTISDRVSMASEKSYCSGIVVDGQVRCCQKALDHVTKSTSEISISSGISSGSETTIIGESPFKRDQNGERELKMTRPKVLNPDKSRNRVDFIEIVTKC
uniref:CSON009159 protein n=1 Tax=Culicoides sonorensis TaxID=179676 RepID=A0A336LJI1_CULSO